MKFLSLSKNKTFVEKLLNHAVNMLVLMLTFMVLTRKYVSFTRGNKETFDTVTSHCTENFVLQKTKDSILITVTYTLIMPGKRVSCKNVTKERMATVLQDQVSPSECRSNTEPEEQQWGRFKIIATDLSWFSRHWSELQQTTSFQNFN